MNRLFFLLILSAFFITNILPQEEPETFVVIGDSLVGKNIDGQRIREVNGNVIMTQGNVNITCDKAIQFLSTNSAQLIGNVIINQDSLRIFTKQGFYDANTKTAYSYDGVFLEDGHMTLNADSGFYYMNDKIADFYGKVRMQDEINNLKSHKLLYYKNEARAVATGNVEVRDTGSVVIADSLIHFRDTKITYGYNNVKIINPKERIVITGDYLEDFSPEKTTIVSGNAFFTQIDTAENGTIDTLYILAEKMTAIQDSSQRIIAEDSVKILRGTFSGRNSKSYYFRDEEKIYMPRQKEDKEPPVMWYNYSQLSGDTIFIYLEKNELKKMDIIKNGLIISQNANYRYRFDQISGDRIKMFFEDRKLKRTDIDGSVLSIYYMFEKEEENGLIKSSSKNAVIFFNDTTIIDVKLYGMPVSEYHPENLVISNEQSFTLPKFIIYSGRPDKAFIKKRQEIYGQK
ncbi:MAG: LPS export ABC transporter periplasmic protein LptC [Ignavibacteria bacterium]|nr:LPS export ABC transporter periplasmic protein LptC [Ignavibacteria bacterium]